MNIETARLRIYCAETYTRTQVLEACSFILGTINPRPRDYQRCVELLTWERPTRASDATLLRCDLNDWHDPE